MKTRMANVMLGAILVILLVVGAGYADLDAGLVAYYPFNGNANDETGLGHNGTVNGASLTTDRFGNPNSAHMFNGGYIDVADAPDLNPTDAITITAWFKATSFHYGYYSWPNIVTKRDDYYPYRGYCMEIGNVYSNNPAMSFAFVLEGDIVGGVPIGPGPFTPQIEEDRWYFVAGVYDGSTVTQYVGPLVAYSENCSGNIVPTSSNLWIGNAHVYGDRSFDGIIDEVRIYNRALSESEIKQLDGTAEPVCIDIKPGSCPNPLNVKDKGVLPVAVLGSESFDVINIDPASIRLEGVAPIRSSYEDVATPIADEADICECTTEGPDGYLDLTLKFNVQDIVDALGEVNDGDELELTLTGVLPGDPVTPIEGTDCVVIISKDKE